MSDDVVLFNSPSIRERKDVLETGNVYPRIGIASLAAYLLENNIKVHIIDPEANHLTPEQIKNRILEIKPSIVGIPAFTEEVHDAAYTASLVKQADSRIVVVVGGPHSSAMPIETLQEFGSFDISVFGEGELTLLDVTSGKDLEEIDGIAYRNSSNIKRNKSRPMISDLNKLPFPAWHLYDLEKYRGKSLASSFEKKERELELPVESARGCPFNCIFCYRIAGRTIRFKSSKRVVDEVEKNVNEFGATKIHFVEGTFGVDRKLAIEMCDELIRRGLGEKIKWSTGGRVDVVHEELLEKMRKAGCEYIGFGVESGVPELLKIVGKNTNITQIVEAFKLCKKIGIKTEADFIIGHPYETEETILRTIEFAKNLEADHATFAIMVPFPGTVIRSMAEKGIGGLKILSNDWRMYGKQIGGTLELQQLPLKRLIELQTKAYKAFYFTPKRFLNFISRLTFKRLIYGLKRSL
ncbi:MAG: radical SAM protein [Candidatus Bathyarchaeia archaeon]